MRLHRVGRAGGVLAGLVLSLWMSGCRLPAGRPAAATTDEIEKLRQELEALRQRLPVARVGDRAAAGGDRGRLACGARGRCNATAAPATAERVGCDRRRRGGQSADRGAAAPSAALPPARPPPVPLAVPPAKAAHRPARLRRRQLEGLQPGHRGDRQLRRSDGGHARRRRAFTRDEARPSCPSRPIVDPYAKADFFVTISPEEVALEEGTITFPTLPGGFLAKVGKMRDAFGKVDALHPHIMPWIDRPLMQKNLLGGEDALADCGPLGRAADPEPLALPRGDRPGVPGQLGGVQGAGAQATSPTSATCAATATSPSRRTSTSAARSRTGTTASLTATTTRLLGADLTFRYRPLRRSIYTSVFVRGEATWSRREERPRPWTPSARTARSSTSSRAASPPGSAPRQRGAGRRAGLRDKGGSFFLTFRPSEFSLLRGTAAPHDLRRGEPANELLFQFLYAIGAHGAHPF